MLMCCSFTWYFCCHLLSLKIQNFASLILKEEKFGSIKDIKCNMHKNIFEWLDLYLVELCTYIIPNCNVQTQEKIHNFTQDKDVFHIFVSNYRFSSTLVIKTYPMIPRFCFDGCIPVAAQITYCVFKDILWLQGSFVRVMYQLNFVAANAACPVTTCCAALDDCSKHLLLRYNEEGNLILRSFVLMRIRWSWTAAKWCWLMLWQRFPRSTSKPIFTDSLWNAQFEIVLFGQLPFWRSRMNFLKCLNSKSFTKLPPLWPATLCKC